MAFTKAIEADPYFSVAFYQRGWVYTQLKQFSKALRDFIQAYQVNYLFNPKVAAEEFFDQL
jgi:tetratricopeptide (TPR) repeat protein